MHSYIIIKPDAFELTVQAAMVRQLFYDFSYFLLYRTVNPKNDICPEFSEEAVRQISERAVCEMSFRGEARKPEVIVASLLAYAETYLCGGLSNVAKVLEDGLRCLSTDVFYSKKVTLSTMDVENIYLDSNEDIIVKLHKYLDRREVVLIDMGKTETFILQWWKTFSRHYFLDYSKEKYPLENLIHVAEEDRVYLKKIMEER